MDIDEYLKKKKELEGKKELLEKKKAVEKKKIAPKKEVVIKRNTEISKVEPNSPNYSPNPHHYPNYNHPKDNMQWVFLGLAFFVALLIVGVYFLSNFMKDSSVDDRSPEVIELEKKLEELQKSLEQEKLLEENKTEEQTNETTNETSNESGEESIGPEVEIKLIDEHTDDISMGTFDSSGKINGQLIILQSNTGDALRYEYRLSIVNKELAVIQCKVDKTTEIDTNEDGTYDDTDYHLDRYVLEMDVGDEEIIADSVTALGSAKVTYEARCYFCSNSQCEANSVSGDPGVFTDGESVESAKLKVIIRPNTLDNNTNSS